MTRWYGDPIPQEERPKQTKPPVKEYPTVTPPPESPTPHDNAIKIKCEVCGSGDAIRCRGLLYSVFDLCKKCAIDVSEFIASNRESRNSLAEYMVAERDWKNGGMKLDAIIHIQKERLIDQHIIESIRVLKQKREESIWD